MDKIRINYRKIFKKPIVIYSFGDFKFPIGLEFKKIMIGILSLIVLFILRLTLFSIPLAFVFKSATLMTLYFIIPTYVIVIIFTTNYKWLNGKTAYRFIYDYSDYFINIKVKKRQYYHDKPLKEEDKIVEFKIY